MKRNILLLSFALGLLPVCRKEQQSMQRINGTWFRIEIEDPKKYPPYHTKEGVLIEGLDAGTRLQIKGTNDMTEIVISFEMNDYLFQNLSGKCSGNRCEFSGKDNKFLLEFSDSYTIYVREAPLLQSGTIMRRIN